MILQIILSFLSAVFAVVVALVVDKKRLPKIEIIAGDKATSDNTYDFGPRKGERWKFFRLSVKNEKMSPFLNWLVIRQTAENCRTKIYIRGTDNATNISFKGRWASTPEIPHLDQHNAFLKLLEPDPVTIPEDNEEFLDVIAKYENDKDGYGWNNEAYFHN